MRLTSLCVIAAVSMLVVSTSAHAGRNNFQFSNVNLAGGANATANALAEANALISDAQERADDADAAASEEDFATRATFNDFLNVAQNDLFAAGPGETGSGNLNGTTYMWEVTGTERVFILNGDVSFTVSCGAGGCI